MALYRRGSTPRFWAQPAPSSLALALLSCGGCTSTAPSSQQSAGILQIVISSDLAIPKDIDRVALLADQGETKLLANDNLLSSPTARLPAVLNLKSPSTSAMEVHLRAVGYHQGQAVALADAWVWPPVTGARRVRLSLSYLCYGDASVKTSAAEPASVKSICPVRTTYIAGVCSSPAAEELLPSSVPPLGAGDSQGCWKAAPCIADLPLVPLSLLGNQCIAHTGIDPRPIPTARRPREDGSVRCWGTGPTEQTGGSTLTKSIPGLSGVTQVSSGLGKACGVLQDTSVRCWGQKNDPALSDSSPTQSIPGLSGVDQIAAGGFHVCARMKDSTVRCWGFNESGQTAGSSTSRPIPGLSGVIRVASGSDFSCALLQSGEVRNRVRDGEYSANPRGMALPTRHGGATRRSGNPEMMQGIAWALAWALTLGHG